LFDAQLPMVALFPRMSQLLSAFDRVLRLGPSNKGFHANSRSQDAETHSLKLTSRSSSHIIDRPLAKAVMVVFLALALANPISFLESSFPENNPYDFMTRSVLSVPCGCPDTTSLSMSSLSTACGCWRESWLLTCEQQRLEVKILVHKENMCLTTSFDVKREIVSPICTSKGLSWERSGATLLWASSLHFYCSMQITSNSVNARQKSKTFFHCHPRQ
jgi:hypothetical protein